MEGNYKIYQVLRLGKGGDSMEVANNLAKRKVPNWTMNETIEQ